MPRSRAITSAILFSKPSDLLLEKGRLSGSPQTRRTLGSSAAAAGHVEANATTAAPTSTLTNDMLFTGNLQPPSFRIDTARMTQTSHTAPPVRRRRVRG